VKSFKINNHYIAKEKFAVHALHPLASTARSAHFCVRLIASSKVNLNGILRAFQLEHQQ
jgi:hypothetical protein